jgi:hypothetical protein
MSILQANGAGLGGAGDPGGALGSFYSTTIDQSLRFEESGAANLTFTPSNNGTDNKKFTYSVWIKRGQSSADDQHLIQSKNTGSGTGQGHVGFILDTSDSLDVYTQNGGANPTGTRLLRDHSGWYHCCFVYDTTEATASDRVKVYINGDRDTLSGSFPPLNSVMSSMNYNGQEQYIGKYVAGSTRYFNGYMAEIHMVDGQALSPTDFAEEVNGIWVPKEYVDNGATSHGVNGYHLDFADSANIGNDVSGNNNDWTANNLAASDVVPDSPTNGFATYNPLPNSSSFRANLSNGNLYNNPGNNCTGFGTIALTTGKKWYMEGIATNAYNTTMGIFEVNDANAIQNSLNTIYYNNTSYKSAFYHRDGTKYIDGANSSYGAAFTTGDLIGMAVDLESATNTITFYKNNVSQGSFNLGANGLDYLFCMSRGSSGGGWHMNFGQDDTFSDSKTSGSAEAQDANGIGDFYYTPPANHLALCSANLPEPAIGPNSTTTSDENFNTVLYTGTGVARSITGVGFQPDFSWFKERSSTSGHLLFDSVRGSGKSINSDSTAAEFTSAVTLTSFDSDGFSLGTSTGLNQSGVTNVAWNWKAGGTAVSNTDGSITSSVSAAPDAGFSIVGFTSTGNTETVGHGLSQAPELYIRKSRTNAENWVNFFTVVDGTLDFMNFNTTNSASGSGASLPTSTVFSIGGGETNGETHVCYCFHSVSGYSAVGSYVGNGSADGTFVYTGFRPAFLLLKKSSAAGDNWSMYDNKRDIDNVVREYLIPNQNAAAASTDTVDFLSNGFKVRNAGAYINTSGATYIYLAFAEAPFKYANAR